MSELACVQCGELLFGRQKKYCSAACQKRVGRAAWVLKTYGITLEEYDTILEFQGGHCALCPAVPSPGKPLHIDHEHRRGEGGKGPLRGLVCAFDNTRIIGRLKSHEKAQKLADYLREPPATLALGREVMCDGRKRSKRTPRKKAR